MKNIFVSLLLASVGTGAFAQDFTDFFTVEYQGKEVENGATIYLSNITDDSTDFVVSYMSNPIAVHNKAAEPRMISGSMQYVKPANATEAANTALWGMAQLCYDGAFIEGVEGGVSLCLAGGDENSVANGEVTVPGVGAGEFLWEPHLILVRPATVSEYRLVMTALEGDRYDYEECSQPFTLNLVFTTTPPQTGLGMEASETEAPIYYDLQGRRIAKPAKGICIERRGASWRKTTVL